jgi:hypothetical protein
MGFCHIEVSAVQVAEQVAWEPASYNKGWESIDHKHGKVKELHVRRHGNDALVSAPRSNSHYVLPSSE